MPSLSQNKTFVNGEWVSAVSKKVFEIHDPAVQKRIGELPDMGVEDANLAIDAAFEAFQQWSNTTANKRSTLLRKWADLIAKNSNTLAEILTAEAGKPLTDSLVELIHFGNAYIEFFAEECSRIYGEIIPSPINNNKLLTEKHPIGVVALITPWNYPSAMVTRTAAAVLAAGCTLVIKPAEDTPFSAVALVELAHEAGFPKGVINVVTCSRQNAPAIGETFCTSPKIAGISFTGSTQVGKLLYKQSANGVKRLSLELGGNSPFIVYKTANIDKAVEGALHSKFWNNGQACIASSRFLIAEEVYDEFVAKLKNGVEKLKVGKGTEDGVNCGPLINAAQFKKVSGMVQDAIDKGAKVLLGGQPAPDLGPLFYKPTILTDIKKNMLVYVDEVFGPVINLIKFKTEEESLKIANDTERGLAGYFYSQDVAQIFRVTRKLEVGMVGVNDVYIVTPHTPFGGIKESGLGRQGSKYGIDDFTYIKHISIGSLD